MSGQFILVKDARNNNQMLLKSDRIISIKPDDVRDSAPATNNLVSYPLIIITYETGSGKVTSFGIEFDNVVERDEVFKSYCDTLAG